MELDVSESIIGTRQRRANAGSRIQTLLEMEGPLDEEDEIFMEVENDEDFEESESEEESDGDDSEEEAERATDIAKYDGDGDLAENDAGANSHEIGAADGDDDNFSDSSDSEIENDEEPADAGEQQLQQQQRAAAREHRRAAKQKMFQIKEHKRPAAENDAPDQVRPIKRKVAPRIETMLDSERRVSKRTSAVEMKKRVIERLKETERKRAEYVAPVVQKAKKLTQEERLEEAKITEMKNTASLRHFVEIEEYRKHQQRLALLSRRPKLTEFIRWRSANHLAYPTVQVLKVEEPKSEPGSEARSNVGAEVEGEAEPGGGEDAPERTATPGEMVDIVENENGGSKEQHEGAGETSATGSVEPSEPPGPDEGQDLDVDLSVNDAIDDDSETRHMGPVTATQDLVVVKPDVKLEDELEEKFAEELDAKAKPAEEVVEIREVEGPPAKRNVAILTLHEFLEPPTNKYLVKRTVLGAKATKAHTPPARRLCPINGVEARYLDPETGIAYLSLDTYRLLRSIRDEHELGWSSTLGGVYIGPRSGQRHAKGVPEGFS